MEKFLRLPRYPFKRAMIEHSPDEPGIYGLFYGDELVYVGRALDRTKSIKVSLLRHQDGVHGECTMKATTYTWEVSSYPSGREAQVLAEFLEQRGHDPLCQKKAA